MSETARLNLKRIDAMIIDGIKVRDRGSDHISQYHKQLKSVILEGEPLSSRADPNSDIFVLPLSLEGKEVLCATLLRLLSLGGSLFENHALWMRSLRFLEKNLSLDLQKKTKLQGRKISLGEKEAILRGLTPRAESGLAETVANLNSLDLIPRFRQSFMSRLNDAVGRAVITPFLPGPLIEIKLPQLLESLSAYRSARGTGVLPAHQRASALLVDFLRQAEAYGTHYSDQYLVRLAERLRDLLEADFQRSPLQRPAKLTIHPEDKKYPLHSPDQAVNLAFSLNNDGPGYAFDVVVEIESATDLVLGEPDVFLGDIGPGQMLMSFEAKTTAAVPHVFTDIRVEWRNFDRVTHEIRHRFELISQGAARNWESLKTREAYHLEPVSTEAELVGRDEVLNRLDALAGARNVGSAFIVGQKRVGKTSIAKTFQSRLKERTTRYVVLYLLTGSYVSGSPEEIVRTLGEKICRNIQRADRALKSIEPPQFARALNPLEDYLEEIVELHPDVRVFIVLDEFDELPLDLYRRDAVGDAFFLTLRSISTMPQVGFLLVGGERMEYVLGRQGDRLNKFALLRVDYFDRSTYWNDFVALVRRPVEGELEFNDEALSELYEKTSGHPYFTKVICQEVLLQAADRRDGYITKREINDAFDAAVRSAGQHYFQHFWEDGIADTPERAEFASIQRRKVLVAVAEAWRHGESAEQDVVVGYAARLGVSKRDTDKELRDFVRRQVLETNGHGYSCKVKFFQEWLKEYGVREILTKFIEEDAAIRIMEENERAKLRELEEVERVRVRSEEIVRLCRSWRSYRGQPVDQELVRAWLEQFGEPADQRVMFGLLKKLNFYSRHRIRERLHEAHGMAMRGSHLRLEKGKLKLSEILVSYLDGAGKSGSLMAKWYGEENRVYRDNVVESGAIAATLERRRDAQTVIFVDDFIGTGAGIEEGLSQMAEKLVPLMASRSILVRVLAVCGFEEGIEAIRESEGCRALNAEVIVADVLTEQDRVFSEASKIFTDREERLHARSLALKFGQELRPEMPLGFGGMEAAVVFEENVPNNTLPILWSSASSWIPLFRRE